MQGRLPPGGEVLHQPLPHARHHRVTEVSPLFALATDAAPGRPNEDFAVASTDLAVVVDGAGIPFGGCHHGVAWYAQQLGVHTLAALIGTPERPLSVDALAVRCVDRRRLGHRARGHL